LKYSKKADRGFMSKKTLAIVLALTFGGLALSGCSGESQDEKESRVIGECFDLWKDRLAENGLTLNRDVGLGPGGNYWPETGEITLYSYVGESINNWKATCDFDGEKVRWISGQTEW
jgi:hypothetical protein